MSVHLVRGADPILRDRVVAEVVAELLGGEDRTLALEEVTIPGRATGSDGGDAGPDGASDGGSGEGEGADARAAAVSTALQGAQSLPFLSARRVVVLREIGRLNTAEAAPLLSYLDDPLETTVLVLAAGGGKTPDNLTKKLRAVGAREHGAASEKTPDVLTAASAEAGLALRPDAVRAITSRLGEDASRVPGLVATLAAAFVPGTRLGAADVEPFLGEEGAVPAYRLTDAIAAGDTASALELVHRLLGAPGPGRRAPAHPLVVLGILAAHYRRLLRLDDPGLTTRADAVAALGGRVSPFVAERALAASRALGADGLRDAFALLHQADLDLKGASAVPGATVLEILVTRLASQARPARSRGLVRR